MTPDHPSPDALDAYRRGQLPPEDLLSVDDHLAACAVCRDAAWRSAVGPASASTPARAPASAVAAALEAITDVPITHPADDTLSAYVDGSLDEVAREIVDTHLGDCGACREEVADLRAFATSMRPGMTASDALAPAAVAAPSGAAGSMESDPMASVRPAPGPTAAAAVTKDAAAPRVLTGPWRPAVRIAVAMAAAALVVWLLMPRGGVRMPARSEESRARTDPAPGPGTSTDPGARPRDPGATPSAVTTLRDGGAVITVDARGEVEGLAATLSGRDRAMVLAALTSGRLPLSASMREIAAEGEVLRGAGPGAGPGARAPFRLREPLGTAVDSDQPRFRWSPAPAARGYVVAIYDEDFARVAQSPTLTTTEWTPDRALARGKTYTWQVTASTPEGSVMVPTAPAPPARFVIIGAADAAGLARLRQAHPEAHLLLAAAYARAGLRAAAEQEIRALQRANPDAPIVTALLNSLR